MKDHCEFLWRVHNYTNEYIRFADTKAVAIIAWAGALIGAMFSKNAQLHFLDGKLWSSSTSLVAWATLLAYVLLAAAFGVAVFVLTPRLTRGDNSPQPNELIYWESIRQFKSAGDYLDAVTNAGDEVRCVGSHLYVLAGISRRKYRLLLASIPLAGVGTLLAIYVLFSQ